MARFYFDTEDGVTDRDDHGTELQDVEASREEACRYLADILRHAPHKLLDTGELKLIVQDGARMTLFVVDVSIMPAPAMP